MGSRQCYGPQAFLFPRPVFVCKQQRERERKRCVELCSCEVHSFVFLPWKVFVHVCKCLHINIFVCMPSCVCGCVNAVYECVCVCVLVLTQLRAQGDNKEFVVGLECPERLELWQLQRSEFTDVALSCRSCRCCLRAHSGSTASAH